MKTSNCWHNALHFTYCKWCRCLYEHLWREGCQLDSLPAVRNLGTEVKEFQLSLLWSQLRCLQAKPVIPSCNSGQPHQCGRGKGSRWPSFRSMGAPAKTYDWALNEICYNNVLTDICHWQFSLKYMYLHNKAGLPKHFPLGPKLELKAAVGRKFLVSVGKKSIITFQPIVMEAVWVESRLLCSIC